MPRQSWRHFSVLKGNGKMLQACRQDETRHSYVIRGPPPKAPPCSVILTVAQNTVKRSADDARTS